MNLRLVVVAAVAGVAVLGTGLAVRAPSGAAQFTPTGGSVAQGKYLVTRAVLCSDCHGANLHGETLPFAMLPGKMPPGMKFEKNAPNIVAMVSSGPADKWVRFFETGVDPSGKQPDIPMPRFRFNHSDAQAIVAYLRSLK
jgi:mono/diheme cytochrome c family protein